MRFALGMAFFASSLLAAERFESREWQATRGVQRTPRSFAAVGVYGSSEVRMRASADGLRWTEWQTAHPDADGALLFFGQQQRFIESDSHVERVLLIDPGETTRTIPHKERSADAPSVVTREQWGCSPVTCPAKEPPAFTTVSHLVVHHSAGNNTATDWAAVVRSIWVLHVNGNGWNDIGYNYLIDPNGILYEGRAGGDGVLGAHFSGVNTGTMGVCLLGTYSALAPREASVATLRELLLWQARRWSVDAGGRSLHAASGLMLNNISGHRDAGLSPRASGTTECPGNGVYALLPRMRSEVRRLMEGECPLSIDRPNRCVSSEAGLLEVGASIPAGCELRVQSRNDWIQTSQDGATLRLEIASNSAAARSGVASVNGQRIDIHQASAGSATQPCIDFNGIVNAANFDQRPLAAGGLFAIFGENLAGANTTRVTVNNQAATVLYVSPAQINAQLPVVNIGSARIVVNRDGVMSTERLISVSEAMPAIFLAVREQPGEISIYYTGGGRNTVTPAATIGTTSLSFVSSEAVAGLPGVQRAIFRIPDGASGDVVLTIAGVSSGPVTVTP